MWGKALKGRKKIHLTCRLKPSIRFYAGVMDFFISSVMRLFLKFLFISRGLTPPLNTDALWGL
ncbi:MAG: hypothetical protein AMJ79_09615 [Phycisphaerae bacterium SM23_30]|nr:MAG: hypothetical protein AMJ79_09615 [Phycisphaerae bacterium SM23_30]